MAKPRSTRAHWVKTDQGRGWTKYERGNCRITVAPSGAVLLIAPGSTSAHLNLAAAKRAACRSIGA